MTNPTVERYPELISLAVHEFRTPASVVGGYLRMLQRDTDTPLTERQRKMIDEAEKSTARLVALIGELSDIGKIDAGLIKADLKPIELGALLDEVARDVQQPEDRDVQLKLRTDGSGAKMNGDAGRLRLAFDAVFRCVLREHAGPATIIAERRRLVVDGRAAAVVVVAEDRTVEEAYNRPHDRFDEKRGGMGLALPLARRVFEQHGGRLLAPTGGDDPIRRSSAIIVLPITE
jgi:signal transduction histidine kinase